MLDFTPFYKGGNFYDFLFGYTARQGPLKRGLF